MSCDALYRAKRTDNGAWVEGFYFERKSTLGATTSAFIIQDAYEQIKGGRRFVRSDIGSECFNVDPATVEKHSDSVESWISVDDRLPELWREADGNLINYLVYMPEYGVDVGNYAASVKTWLCMGIPCKVTHWMPLPQPPKEDS